MFDTRETFILRCFPEEIKELFGHEDLDDKHHGSDIEMAHVDNHDEPTNHPYCRIRPDHERFVLVLIIDKERAWVPIKNSLGSRGAFSMPKPR